MAVAKMPRLTGNREPLFSGWNREVDRIAEQYGGAPLGKVEVYINIWAACMVLEYGLTPENVIPWIVGIIDEYERPFIVDAAAERHRRRAKADEGRKAASAAERRRRAELRRKAAP